MRISNSLKLRAGLVGMSLAISFGLSMVPASPAMAAPITTSGAIQDNFIFATVTPATSQCRPMPVRSAVPCYHSNKPGNEPTVLPAWARWVGILCLSALFLIPFWVKRRIKKVEKERAAQQHLQTSTYAIESDGTTYASSADETGSKGAVRFDQVIGQHKAKSACEDSVRWLKNAHVLKALGAYAPVGIILAGPPGTGKTLLAKAVAGEAGVPIFETGGSDFAEKFVGVGAKRIRALFAKAKAQAPCIVFFDEIDSFAHPRGSNDGTGGAGEDHKIVNALLKEINDLRQSGVLVMAATNFFDNIDPALVRPGRLEVRVNLTLPKVEDRRKLFVHYFEKKKLAADVDFDTLAQKTAGMSGASIERICNEAALALGRTIVPLIEEIHAAETAHSGPIEAPAEKSRRKISLAVPRIKNSRGVSIEEKSIDAGKLRIAEVLLANGEGIKMEMVLAAIENEVHSQASRSDGNRYQQLGDPVSFDDLKGLPELVEELEELRDVYLSPENFAGQTPPKGILLKGPPGGGKTLAARALASEIGLPFFSVVAASFDKGLVGSGADAVRKFFAEAKACAPAAVFIDEIDAVARKRDGSSTADVYTQTLTALLNELDGFEQNPDERILFMCATNQADRLDEALTRPGRVDRQVTVNRCDVSGREELFHHYMKNKELADDVDLKFFAETSAGLSASAIANVCNEAGFMQRRMNKESGQPNLSLVISSDAINHAITRELMGGAQRKSRIVSVEDKFNVAVHEGGHAGVHHVVSNGELIARITIMAWGESGGHVQQLDKSDFMPQRQELINRICVCLGGRVAQQVVLNRTDVGASNDFQQARTMAYYMVTEYGMSPLGALPAIQGVERSSKEKAAVEAEVDKILRECETRVRTILIENRHRIDAIVTALMKKQTILGPEFKEIWESASLESGAKKVTSAESTRGVVIDFARRSLGLGAILRGKVAESLDAIRFTEQAEEDCC